MNRKYQTQINQSIQHAVVSLANGLQ